MRVNLYILNTFFSRQYSGGGNKACIIHSSREIKNISPSALKKLDFPVVCFINQENNLIRYFSPDGEMPFCVHGTVSACKLLNYLTKKKNFELITADKKKLNLFVKKNAYGVSVKGVKRTRIKPGAASLESMLGMTQPIPHPPEIISIGSKKCLVEVKSYSQLNTLKPDFDRIKKWSQKNNINGLYVYTTKTRYKKIDFQSRSFNPGSGNNEDLATGVAAGALCWAKNAPNKTHFKIGQGKNNRLNQISVEVNKQSDTTTIFGSCILLEIKKDYEF